VDKILQRLKKQKIFVKALGVEEEHIRIIKPLRRNHEENVKVLKEEISYKGVSVVIARRECVQTLGRRMKLKAQEKRKETSAK